jgi:hypothetical protein
MDSKKDCPMSLIQEAKTPREIQLAYRAELSHAMAETLRSCLLLTLRSIDSATETELRQVVDDKWTKYLKDVGVSSGPGNGGVEVTDGRAA